MSIAVLDDYLAYSVGDIIEPDESIPYQIHRFIHGGYPIHRYCAHFTQYPSVFVFNESKEKAITELIDKWNTVDKTTLKPVTIKEFYDLDFYLWAKLNATLQFHNQSEALDNYNLITEIAQMGNDVKRSIRDDTELLINSICIVDYWREPDSNYVYYCKQDISHSSYMLSGALEDSASLLQDYLDDIEDAVNHRVNYKLIPMLNLTDDQITTVKAKLVKRLKDVIYYQDRDKYDELIDEKPKSRLKLHSN